MREYREWGTWVRLSKQARPYAEELLSNEIFVLSSAIAMNALLAFFPFVILLASVSRLLLPASGIDSMVYDCLRQYLPLSWGNQTYIFNIIQPVSRGFTQVHIISFIVLIWSLANVFIPLEMALNRAWGVRESRGFWRSQWFAMFMVGISALLAMAFVGGAAFTKYRLLDAVIGPEWQLTHAFLEFAIIKTWMVPFTFLMFFVVFYLVPNTKVNWREVLPASAFTAVLWEISNYVFVWLLPLLGLRDIYGTFIIGVTLMTWGYVSGLLLVLGANLTAKRVFAARQAASGYANDAHPDQSSADV